MTYWYPNRPILASPDSITVDEMSNSKHCVAEIKKNGDRLVLIKEKGKFLFFNRHRSILKYDPPKSVVEDLSQLNVPDGSQLDAELIHRHTKEVKNLIFFYDVYQWGGKQMTGDLSERRECLDPLFEDITLEHLRLAYQYSRDFMKLFNVVTEAPENEGLVMKDLRGKIEFNRNKSPDVWWQVKIRKPTKNSRI